MRKLAFILSLVLIFTIPWEDAFTFAGVASLTRYVGILTLLVWLATVVMKGKVRRPNVFHIILILFLLWNIASLFWTFASSETIQQIMTYVQLLALTLIIWDLYGSSKELISALQAFILGEYVAIFSTIYNYIRGQQISIYSGGRYAGVGNANDLALVLTLGLPIAWFLATSIEIQKYPKIFRLLNIVYVPLAMFAIILTGTRTAIFAVIPALAYIISRFYRLKPIVRVSFFVAILGALFWFQSAIPKSTIERLESVFNSISTGDLGGRLNLWRQSMLIFQTHPIIGIGSGALFSPFELGSVAHNTFLSILAELGLVGFAFFMCLLGVVVLQAIRQKKDFARLWIVILAIWTIGVFTLTWEYRKVTWFLFTLIVVAANFSREKIVQKRSVITASNLAMMPRTADK